MVPSSPQLPVMGLSFSGHSLKRASGKKDGSRKACRVGMKLEWDGVTIFNVFYFCS